MKSYGGFVYQILPSILTWAFDSDDGKVQIPLLNKSNSIVRISRKNIRHVLSNAFLMNTTNVGEKKV